MKRTKKNELLKIFATQNGWKTQNIYLYVANRFLWPPQDTHVLEKYIWIALCKVFRDRSVFIFILDTRCAVNFLVISATGTNSTRVRGEMTRLGRTAYRVPDKLKYQTFEWKTDLADIMSTNHHHLCCQPFHSTIIVYYCLKVVPKFYHIHLQVVSKWSQNCLRVLWTKLSQSCVKV